MSVASRGFGAATKAAAALAQLLPDGKRDPLLTAAGEVGAARPRVDGAAKVTGACGNCRSGWTGCCDAAEWSAGRGFPAHHAEAGGSAVIGDLGRAGAEALADELRDAGSSMSAPWTSAPRPRSGC